MNKEDLEEASFYDVAIAHLSDGRYALVLISENNEKAAILYSILKANNPIIELTIKQNREYNLYIDFKKNNLRVIHEFETTKENYADMMLLANSKVNLLTSGAYNNNGQLLFHDDYLVLNRPQLN